MTALDSSHHAAREGTPVLVLFLAATLIVVAGVVFAGATESWWVLAPVVAVHLIMLVAVMLSIYWLLDDRDGGRTAR